MPEKEGNPKEAYASWKAPEGQKPAENLHVSWEQRRNQLSVEMQQNEAARNVLAGQIERIKGLINTPGASSMSREELTAESERLNDQIIRLNEKHRELGQQLRG